MKYFLPLIFAFFILSACSNTSKNTVLVTTNTALQTAINNAKPGTTIVLKDGVWPNISIKFKAEGTKENPITLKAETPGNVFIEGVSNLSLAGNYLVVNGLYFRNGHSPTKNVIAFKINNTLANNSIVTNCVIKDFNKLQRDKEDLWVQFFGRHNELSHTYLAGKTNGGPTVRVDLKGNRSINNYHKIINNHFGPRPRKGGARGETIQLGSSFTSMSPSYTLIANNLFEECNGEVEIISSKTNFNTIKNNVFYKSEGSVVTRHGNYATINGNYFIGDGVNKQFGGIRLVNTGHWVVNNYFYNIIGTNFRSPLAVMNGIPKSPLNRYNQVTDVVVAYNTYIDCASPWQFGVGTNIAQKEVLPKSEIRSARPIRTTVANNIIYNSKGDKNPIVEHDKADGITFKSNVINNNGMAFNNKDRFIVDGFTVSKINTHIAVPKDISEDISAFNGFEFNSIKSDLFGNERTANTGIGAVVKGAVNAPKLLSYKKYGASWFTATAKAYTPKTVTVANVEALRAALKNANNTDTIVLEKGTYTLKNPLEIKKHISITSQKNTNIEVVYTGAKNTPAFALHPYGILTLKNINLTGNTNNYAFASLKENMFNHFGLAVINCNVSNFNYVLKVYKQSFAEQITFKNSQLFNCENGLELSEETNDRGDYNTEYLTIDKCNFNNIPQNVIDYYRGGYDESTIGGNLLVTNSTFTNCGAKEANNMLLNHRGIVNVTINNNSFKDNKVDYVSVLWGAKNNSASNNTFSNSSKIKTEENLVQKLMY